MTTDAVSPHLDSIDQSLQTRCPEHGQGAIFSRLESDGMRSTLFPRERRAGKDVDRFMRMMRDRGNGNIALAWRRYFDSDGDGELSFREFCKALADLNFIGNVSQLWIDLGGSMSHSLCLSALDPQNAHILEVFVTWCKTSRGGPMEVFHAIDMDGSDSITCQEFAEGLRALGFFDAKGLPERLMSEMDVLANLYPLLDQNGLGCITPEHLLFLERDKEKRARLQREVIHTREHGKNASVEPVRNNASEMLHKLVKTTTLAGGRHWKSLKATSPALRDVPEVSRINLHSSDCNRPGGWRPCSLANPGRGLARRQPAMQRSRSSPMAARLPQRVVSGPF